MNTSSTLKSASYITIGLTALRKISLSTLAGSKISFLALDQALAPLGGFFATSMTTFFVYAFRTVLQLIFAAKTAAWFIHLPTLAGTLVLSTQSRSVKAAIPLLCIALFIAHPVGLECWTYTLYWIPPLMLGAINLQVPFLRALAATLTTHAVGSTLWIYTHQTNTLFWHALLPIVWYERLAFALCLTAGFYTLNTLKPFIQSNYFAHARSLLCNSITLKKPSWIHSCQNH